MLKIFVTSRQIERRGRAKSRRLTGHRRIEKKGWKKNTRREEKGGVNSAKVGVNGPRSGPRRPRENIVIARCAPGNETFTPFPLTKKRERKRDIGIIFILPCTGDHIFRSVISTTPETTDDSTGDLTKVATNLIFERKHLRSLSLSDVT